MRTPRAVPGIYSPRSTTKPAATWRLRRERSAFSRLYHRDSFKHAGANDRLFQPLHKSSTSSETASSCVARLPKNRTSISSASELEEDAHALLTDALARYRQEHGTTPAAVTVHKTSDTRRRSSRALKAQPLPDYTAVSSSGSQAATTPCSSVARTVPAAPRNAADSRRAGTPALHPRQHPVLQDLSGPDVPGLSA